MTQTTTKGSGARPSTVVVAGASGFIGQALGRVLAQSHEVVGLTRNSNRKKVDSAGYRYSRCDLFSLKDAERALRGADYAVYLVHSMMPSGRLTQGSFSDLDAVCADNFARAASAAGVKHIVYLSGLLPSSDHLSDHLASRFEVENILAGYDVPVTVIRAGLVIGAGGSSFEMMLRLVRRLPAMVCPRWTATMTQPVALRDVVQVIAQALGESRLFGQQFDVGVPKPMSYADMMKRIAAKLEIQRPMLGVRWLSPRLSRLWVSLVTGAPRELVEPLVESLRHEMLARDLRIYECLGIRPSTFDEALSSAFSGRVNEASKRPHAFVGASDTAEPRVVAIQRLALPSGKSASWALAEYLAFIPRVTGPVVTVKTWQDGRCEFLLKGFREPLLKLRFALDQSSSTRQLFYVSGGMLCGNSTCGRFEFRELPNSDDVLCGVYDFAPRLPWYVYLGTQAWVHRFILEKFQKHVLRRPDGEKPTT